MSSFRLHILPLLLTVTVIIAYPVTNTTAYTRAPSAEFVSTPETPYLRYKYNSDTGELEWFRTDTDADSISINGVCMDLTHTTSLSFEANNSINITIYDEKSCDAAGNNPVLSQGVLLCNGATMASATTTPTTVPCATSSAGNTDPFNASSFAAPACTTFGLSFDGNEHDPDDISAIAMSMAIIDTAGVWDKIVHFDFNSHYPNAESTHSEPNTDMADKMRASFAAGWKGNPGAVFDLTEDTPGAIANLNTWLQTPGFCYIVGGPWEIVNRGLDAAGGMSANATVITHSGWNDTHTEGNSRSREDAENAYTMNVIGINNQNGPFSQDINAWDWLTDYGYGIVPEAIARSGLNKGDVSDAGMMFYALTGNDSASMDDIIAFFDDGSAIITEDNDTPVPVTTTAEGDSAPVPVTTTACDDTPAATRTDTTGMADEEVPAAPLAVAEEEDENEEEPLPNNDTPAEPEEPAAASGDSITIEAESSSAPDWQTATIGGQSALLYVGEGKDGQRGECEDSSRITYSADVAVAGTYLISIHMTKACDYGTCGASDRNNDVFIYAPDSPILNTASKYFTSGMNTGEWKDNDGGSANNIDMNHVKSKALVELTSGANNIIMCGRSDLVAVDKIVLIPQDSGLNATAQALNASSFADMNSETCVFNEGETIDFNAPATNDPVETTEPETPETAICEDRETMRDVTRMAVPQGAESIASSAKNYIHNPITVMIRHGESVCAEEAASVTMTAAIMSDAGTSVPANAFFAGSVGDTSCTLAALSTDAALLDSDTCNCGNLWAVRFTPDRAGTYDVTVHDNAISVTVDDEANPDHTDTSFMASGMLAHSDNAYLKFNTEDGQYIIPAGLYTPDNIWERYLTGAAYQSEDGAMCDYDGYLRHVSELGFTAHTVTLSGTPMTPARYMAYSNMLDMMYYYGIIAHVIYDSADSAVPSRLVAALNHGAAIQWSMANAPEERSVTAADSAAQRIPAPYDADTLAGAVIPALSDGASALYLTGTASGDVNTPWAGISDTISHDITAVITELGNTVNCMAQAAPGEPISVTSCGDRCLTVSTDTRTIDMTVSEGDSFNITLDPPASGASGCSPAAK